VQDLDGSRADLCTFAKAGANGYPSFRAGGARGDQRKIGRVRRARAGLHARRHRWRPAEKTLQILDEPTPGAIADYGTRLRTVAAYSAPAVSLIVFVGTPSMIGLYFRVTNRRAIIVLGRAATISFYDAMAQVLHTSACCASRIRASLVSSRRHTMSPASPTH